MEEFGKSRRDLAKRLPGFIAGAFWPIPKSSPPAVLQARGLPTRTLPLEVRLGVVVLLGNNDKYQAYPLTLGRASCTNSG